MFVISEVKNQQRRKDLMGYDAIKGFLSGLILVGFLSAFLFALPQGAMAGKDGGDQAQKSDEPGDFLVGYWDLRDRETLFQVTNASGNAISVHIQVWNASDPDFPAQCTEFDFTDSYTQNDTHVYNLRNLTRNDGGPLSPPILTNGHGYIYATVTTGPFGSGCNCDNNFLLGNTRMLDVPGEYEYRVNAVDIDVCDNGASDLGKENYAFNFNQVDNTTFSDVVFFAVDAESNGLCSGEPRTLDIEKEIVDVGEFPNSCPESVLGCEEEPVEIGELVFNPVIVNAGINQALQNSRDGFGGINIPSICSGTLLDGWMALNLETHDSGDCFFEDACGGFIGLNNGDGTGSMDLFVGIDDDFGFFSD